ncbi:MAG TPA: LamG-like jellyroll fold domain-containing protein, partial [Gemmataceae bacterium]|nr:LamG-like jellyroll fold domain-containing protein [Gemmataceae bacterium]
MRPPPRFRRHSPAVRSSRICLERLEVREVPHAVAAYSFDAGAGTTVTDLSGNANHGTIAGATWTSGGRYGGALSFDGADDMITIPDANSLDLTTGFTLEAWVQSAVAQPGWTTILFKERPGDGTYALFGHMDNGLPGTGFNTATGDFLVSSSTALAVDAWTHLAATYDGTTLTVYRNGQVAGTRAASGLITTSNDPVRIGGNSIFGEYFHGLIDEVQIHDHARTAAEIQQDMNTPLEVDTTPPAVLSVVPVPNATGVNPDSNVSARFTEDLNPATVSAATVELRDANGVAVPADVTYDAGTETVILNPTASLAPSAMYTAILKGGAAGLADLAGNPLAADYTWSFQTGAPASPATVGQWSPVMDWPLVAINTVLLQDGRVLMWDGGPNCIGSESARVWDPATNTFTQVPIPYAVGQNDDIFCSGQVLLADGRVLVVGGHDCDGPGVGIKMTNIFDPVTMTWTHGPDMTYARWYPTVTLLPDGKALVVAGSDVSNTTYIPIPEVYDPVTNTWTTLPAASVTIPNYPFVFVLPDGRLVCAGSDEGIIPTRILDVNTQTWTTVDTQLVDGGSAVMYEPGKVMKAGSSYQANGSGLSTVPSFPTTYAIDMTEASPAWRQTASMNYSRAHHNLTILPDGTVFASGGTTTLGGADPDTAVYPTEVWSPTTETWSLMASMATPRLYHSTAMLLPDGRVLSAGGGHNYTNTVAFFSAEIYSPTYLFQGDRPVVTSAPGTLEYGSSFFVGTPNAAGIAKVVLIKNGSVTHQVNMDQRYVPLTFTQAAGGLTVQAPANPNLAPPGYYMLFIVDTNGVPSVAPMVRFAAPYEDSQPPTAPGDLTATGGLGTATLSWTAATDNIGVTGYRVYRSTTPNFTPSAANQVGTTTGTSFVSTGMAAGTYYFRVTAHDAAGNVGPSSNEQSAVVTADTTPPTVGMTAPASGTTVSGSTTVSADASDDVGVVGVQFLLDGQPLGAEDTTAPYSVSWNTTATLNGSHTLTARARDAAGNATTSAGVPVTVSNAAAATGLVLALGFDEGTGSTTQDLSGTGNNGTLSNAAWTAAGRYGGSLSFNGTNAWVTVPHSTSLDLTTGMTLEAWVKPAVAMPAGAWTTVLFKERPSVDGNYGLFGHMGEGRPGLGFNTPAGDILTTAPTALAVGAWTHLAATFGAGTVTVYVNGVAVATRTATGPITTSVAPLRVGGNSIFGEWFNGLIDEVRVYNRARSAAEITTDMNSPIGDAPPTVTGVSPAANAGGVALGSVVTATFSEAMDAATVTASTFTLRNPG